MPETAGGRVKLPKRVRKAIRWELVMLWTDLAEAKRRAANHQWSMSCDSLVARIGALTAIVGPVRWQDVEIPLLIDGTYTRVHRQLGVQTRLTDDIVERESRRWDEYLAAGGIRRAERQASTGGPPAYAGAMRFVIEKLARPGEKFDPSAFAASIDQPVRVEVAPGEYEQGTVRAARVDQDGRRARLTVEIPDSDAARRALDTSLHRPGAVGT